MKTNLISSEARINAVHESALPQLEIEVEGKHYFVILTQVKEIAHPLKARDSTFVLYDGLQVRVTGTLSGSNLITASSIIVR